MVKAQGNTENVKSVQICIHKPALRNQLYYPSLIFEFLITSYYIILLLSGMNNFNTRIIIYGILFCLNECIKNVNVIRDIIDPLNLTPIKNFLNWLHLLIEVNIIYLLIRLIYQLQTISTLVLALHLIVNSLKKMKISSYPKKTIDLIKAMNFINPILLFAFAKTLHNQFADLSLVFLIIFCANLLITSQLRQLLAMNENDVFGWQQIKQNGKNELFWDKQYALKTIVMSCCVCLVVQNFLLIFDALKTEAGLAIIHTLLLGVTAHVLYLKKSDNVI